MLKSLVKLANRLDSLGLMKEADVIDKEILKLASGAVVEPADEDPSVSNLELIKDLPSYNRWLYMSKNNGKNSEFYQNALEGGKLSEAQSNLLEEIFTLCAEDFSHESEYQYRMEEEAALENLKNEPVLSDAELDKQLRESGYFDESDIIPDYRGKGVSVFRDPKAPFVRMDEKGKLHMIDRNKLSIRPHPRSRLKDEDISVRTLEDSGIIAPEVTSGKKRKSVGPLRPFDQSMLPKDKKKRFPKSKIDRIERLEARIKELRDHIEVEEDKELKAEFKKTLNSLIGSLSNLVTGEYMENIPGTDSEEVSDESGSKSSSSIVDFSQHTLADIDLDNYYVFELMTRPGSKKEFWVTKGEFLDQEDAEKFKNRLVILTGDESKVKILDGYDAKDLISSGEGRFRLEAWSGGKLPKIMRERDGVTKRLDPEKQENEGFGFGGLSGFGRRGE